MNNEEDNIGLAIPRLSKNDEHHSFEDLYIALRSTEKRLYTDQEVYDLPKISNDHIHSKEWIIRRASCHELAKYLKKKSSLSILEVGCGNGWLAHQLSRLPGSTVTGIDVNDRELNQAKRVFHMQKNVKFISCAVDELISQENHYDIVVFAASIQYFQSFNKIVNDAIGLLNKDGEIHIIDSAFYQGTEINEARSRSKKYFSSIGFPEMENHYFHHSIDELRAFSHSILHNPNSLTNKLSRNKNPFYWIRIRTS
jgi:ubiquinone/menaquinone biosynthesis C-methylase UbiE